MVSSSTGSTDASGVNKPEATVQSTIASMRSMGSRRCVWE